MRLGARGLAWDLRPEKWAPYGSDSLHFSSPGTINSLLKVRSTLKVFYFLLI